MLECIPAAAHPMDVMRTGCSALGAALPEKDDHSHDGAREIADRLIASYASMLVYWHHYSQNGRRIEVETDDDSIGGHFLTCCMARHSNSLCVSVIGPLTTESSARRRNIQHAGRSWRDTGALFHCCFISSEYPCHWIGARTFALSSMQRG